MLKYKLTGFADEISPDLNEQMDVLDQLGIHYLEARGVDGKNLCDYTLEEAAVVKKRLDERGFHLSAIGSPLGKVNITDAFDEHFAKFLHVCDLASLFETKYIRMFSFFMPAGEDPAIYRDEVLARLQKMIDEATRRGLVLLHENEKGIYGDIAERCADLMQNLSCANFRTTFDPANYVQCGTKPYPDGYTLMAPYIEYMHIKDALFADNSVTPAGKGDGQVPAILSKLSETDYEGFLSLEPHLTNFVGFSALEQDAETELKEGASEGARLFALAYQSLMDLLKQVPSERIG